MLATRMTTFIKTKFKKSDYQTNIDKYKVAANITEYHIISKLIFLRIIIPIFKKIRQLFHVKNVWKNVKKINMFKMDIWTFWSQLLSCCAFYIVPNCIKNHHTKFEIGRTILKKKWCLKWTYWIFGNDYRVVSFFKR